MLCLAVQVSTPLPQCLAARQLGKAPPSGSLHLYTGEQMDPDLGMYYLRARYYQPQAGRFWNMDSFEGRIFNPLPLHKYLYCNGNPINERDPSGREGESASTLAGGNLGADISASTGREAARLGTQLRSAFVNGNYSEVGSLFRQFGQLAEKKALEVINLATRGQVTVAEQHAVGAGGRSVDYFLQAGARRLWMEVKYSLPRSGAAFTRIVAQIKAAGETANGGRILVWSYRAASTAAENAIKAEVGVAVDVEFAYGVEGLFEYLTTFFVL